MMSNQEAAQSLADQARLADKPAKAQELARRALELDGECTDAQVIVAQAEQASPRLLARQLRVIVERAEARLGAPFLREAKGRLWDLVLGRPYLRARLVLAETLDKAGRPAEAIPHLEGILALDAEDHLGMRDKLVCMLLEAKQLKGLTAQFKGMEETPFKAWAQVLAKVKAEDEKGAQSALAKARSVNACVEEFLTGRRKMPRKLADEILPGSPEEALLTLKRFGETWTGDREALYWLFRQGDSQPSDK